MMQRFIRRRARTETLDLRVYCPGGLVSTRQMRQIAELTLASGEGLIQFGERQDLTLCNIEARRVEECRRVLKPLVAENAGQESGANVMSTAPVAVLCEISPWLAPSAYLDILAALPNPASISISIVDPRQDILPRFLSRLNFIATARPDYWRICFRFAGKDRPAFSQFPIHASAIGKIARAMEIFLSEDAKPTLAGCDAEIAKVCGGGLIADAAPLPPPQSLFHDHAGMHVQKDKLFALGLAPKDGRMPAALLQEVCLTAQSQGIRSLGLGGWSNLIVGGIASEAAAECWKMLMARHADIFESKVSCLHWRLASDAPRYRRLRARWTAKLRRELGADAACSIALAGGDDCPPAAIQIRETSAPKKMFKRFSISYRKDLKQDHPELTLFADGLPAGRVPGAVAGLIREQRGGKSRNALAHAAPEAPSAAAKVHQCARCLTVYDETIGDPAQESKTPVPFRELPAEWQCPVCEAGRESYRAVDPSALEEPKVPSISARLQAAAHP